METKLNCTHSWLLASRKADDKLVIVSRRCVHCGRVEDIWEDVNTTDDFPLTISQVMHMFHEHLQDCFRAEWEEALKTPPSLGYPFGGILLKALDKAFKNVGVTLKL